MPNRLLQPARIQSCKGLLNGILGFPSDTFCRKLWELFLNLPGELQLEILCELSPSDISSLRATCRAFHEVIHKQASPIVRHLIKTSIFREEYIGLYPLPEPPTAVGLDYLYGTSHRLCVVRGLSHHMADFIMTKICRCHTSSQVRKFTPRYNNMVANMIPALLVLFHFFESYRAALVISADKRIFGGDNDGGTTGFFPNFACEESEIIRKYDTWKQLWRAHSMYRLLTVVFGLKLRPPSYAGKLERTLRGWGKKPATREDLVKLMVLGGLEEVKNILGTSSYRAGRNTLNNFLSCALPSKEQKRATRQYFPCLAREGASRPSVKKVRAAAEEEEKGPVSCDVVPAVGAANHSRPYQALSKISCSVMPRLGIDTTSDVCRFLPESDSIWSIWTTTAERHIIERGVIQSRGELPTLRQFVQQLMAESLG